MGPCVPQSVNRLGVCPLLTGGSSPKSNENFSVQSTRRSIWDSRMRDADVFIERLVLRKGVPSPRGLGSQDLEDQLDNNQADPKSSRQGQRLRLRPAPFSFHLPVSSVRGERELVGRGHRRIVFP